MCWEQSCVSMDEHHRGVQGWRHQILGRSKRLGGKLLLVHLMPCCLNTSKSIIYAVKFSLLQVRPAPAWLQKLALRARLKLLNCVFHDKSVFWWFFFFFSMIDVTVWGKKGTGRWRAEIFNTVLRFYWTNASSCYCN